MKFWFNWRVIFNESTDRSYEMFIYWLGQTRGLFDTIIMLNTQNDLATKQKHVTYLENLVCWNKF